MDCHVRARRYDRAAQRHVAVRSSRAPALGESRRAADLAVIPTVCCGSATAANAQSCMIAVLFL